MQNSKHLVECLVNLSNSIPLLKRMHEEKMELLLPKILLPETEDFEDTKDRLMILTAEMGDAENAV